MPPLDLKQYCLLTFDERKELKVDIEGKDAYKLDNWLHPWHINIPAKYTDDREVYQTLINLHIRGNIQIGDIITGIRSSSLTNLAHVAKIFTGEYDTISEFKYSSEKEIQALTRVTGSTNAEICTDLPKSIEDLTVKLRKNGHVLIRNLVSIDEHSIVTILGGAGQLMDYRYGNTVRENIKNSQALKVTTWPRELMLPAHNEMTYHIEFPTKIAFLCQEPSKYGGETSLYDCAKSFEYLSREMQQKVTHQDVICRKRYVQQDNHNHYPSWQQVLGKGSSFNEAIEHFTSLGYQCNYFLPENQAVEQNVSSTIIETTLPRPMVYSYQGRQCLHASMVPLVSHWCNQLWPDVTPPLTVTWENGEPITHDEFNEMNEAILSARINYGGWQKNDVLIIDNLRIAHGRLPFLGQRSIGVLMAEPARFVAEKGNWAVS
ncbi:TauD/TfdA family dioxygenase [Scytonema hofmannii FACHB-248]|uniref:TauD/TfdA family dioxygenase n=1 Tax=Scytonema hofmannii FACHB-248 TaxID=1842502 RepID=A0ABR8GV51_9CYAN|nr:MULTISPECIES: TauD/TfdA family dioxygenase [Nostocales]MBD2607032.1 TauD/TfdA family dioxygenase [Scytonema hofmannii FACHB-248]